MTKQPLYPTIIVGLTSTVFFVASYFTMPYWSIFK